MKAHLLPYYLYMMGLTSLQGNTGGYIEYLKKYKDLKHTLAIEWIFNCTDEEIAASYKEDDYDA